MPNLERSTAYCSVCDAQVVTVRDGTNHILHLLLSIVTAGLWLFVWLLISFKVGGWSCNRCGSKDSMNKNNGITLISTKNIPKILTKLKAKNIALVFIILTIFYGFYVSFTNSSFFWT